MELLPLSTVETLWKETDICETFSWSEPRNWKPVGLNSADSKHHLWLELPVLCVCLQTDHSLEAPLMHMHGAIVSTDLSENPRAQ